MSKIEERFELAVSSLQGGEGTTTFVSYKFPIDAAHGLLGLTFELAAFRVNVFYVDSLLFGVRAGIELPEYLL